MESAPAPEGAEKTPFPLNRRTRRQALKLNGLPWVCHHPDCRTCVRRIRAAEGLK